MLTFQETFSTTKEFLPLLTFVAGGVAAAGLAPRIGPGRALWIALRSRFAVKPVPESLRVSDIKLLKEMIALKDFGEGYLIVTGEKGVGKSCLIDTVTSKTAGVINVQAQPHDNQHAIIKNTLQTLTRINFDFIPPSHSAHRVVFWYRLFTFGRSPIIVINATERKVGEGYAGLAGAVRTLVEKYKLRVIVDGSPNSLDENLLRTIRQSIIDVKPMDKEMIWRTEQFQGLFKYVKEAGLEDTVFAVLGGIPAKYEKLWRDARIDLQAGKPPREVSGFHLCAEIHAEIKLVRESCGNKPAIIEKLMKLFQETRVLTKLTLAINKLQRPAPDKVLREVVQDNDFVLIPASNAIGIVLQHQLTKKPTLDELEVLLKT